MVTTAKQLKGKKKVKVIEHPASANWLALQKKITKTSKSTGHVLYNKRGKIKSTSGKEDENSEAGSSRLEDASRTSNFPRGHEPSTRPVVYASVNNSPGSSKTPTGDKRESLDYLRKMVLGGVEYSEEQKQPGKYLALDCEMVGVGPEGIESSLARVSLVNYHGAIILDEFVRQRERVVDYRTAVSGVRAEDMAKAIPFIEIQKRVADLLKDRILVGHAVNNDLKALLLSHSRLLIRDTQLCAGKARLLKTKYPALRKLVQQELGIAIQAGEHSSVTDARATVALYRLHRKEWDKGFRTIPSTIISSKSLGKRKASAEEDEGEFEADSDSEFVTENKPKASQKAKGQESFPGGGRRGVSSGLSTVIKRGSERRKSGKHGTVGSESRGGGGKGDWWATLGSVGALTSQKGSKGSMRISRDS